ncbi:MAG: rare lipoprotein A [bacterium P3]|nr:MAG: rare lipoprotein A [bacterium P3]KWW42426.1 MAG: rare lipoprotein A [bacterium F083]
MVASAQHHFITGLRRVIAMTVILTASFQLPAAPPPSPDDTLATLRMKATFYADRFHGRRTASGEIFDQSKATAAHISIKLGTWVRVTNLKNGKQVIVKINDRCPKRGLIDLTRSAARSIGIRGTSDVTVEILPSEEFARQLIEASAPDKELPLNDPPPLNLLTTSQATPSENKGTRTIPTSDSNTKMDPAPRPVPPKTDKKKAAGQHDGDRLDDTRYSLYLGQSATLQQARQQVEAIPTPYRRYISLIPDGQHSDIQILLDIQQNKREAERTLQKIQKAFPHAQLIQQTQ